ncbi:MAG: DUF542 domain-containing protein [Gemmatimonadales bacterium]|nr:DUF542 domain-containing protein [Gemmatimonadales bacterium]
MTRLPQFTPPLPPPAPTIPAEGPMFRALDARPILAMGEEPFGAILGEADLVPLGGVLELTAPFEPVPLYGVLGQRGFAHQTSVRGPGEYVVRFVQTGITPSATVRELLERYPAIAPLIAEHGFDTCCGGTHALGFAAQAHGVALPELLARLQTAATS